MKDPASKPAINSSIFSAGDHGKKKAINFGDSADNTQTYSRPPISKDAPTIGNPLMMKMEF
jgi:hypothetical protein